MKLIFRLWPPFNGSIQSAVKIITTVVKFQLVKLYGQDSSGGITSLLCSNYSKVQSLDTMDWNDLFDTQWTGYAKTKFSYMQ